MRATHEDIFLQMFAPNITSDRRAEDVAFYKVQGSRKALRAPRQKMRYAI